MKMRWIGVLALMVTIFTFAWVVLLVISLSGAPQIDSIEDQIAFVVSPGRLYPIMYLRHLAEINLPTAVAPRVR